MGLRRRRKRDDELVELVRGELASIRAEVQAALTETAAVLSVRMRTELEERVGEPSALVAGIQDVRATIAARESELAYALKRVVDTCDTLSERVQIDRVERAALVDAIGRLTTALNVAGTIPLAWPPPPSRATVLGGTVDPEQTAPAEATALESVAFGAGTDHEIDLEAAARLPEPTGPPGALPVRPDGVEVRCRFGDRWVTGFEVCEVIRLDGATRYRLRRRSDGAVIPTLFDEKDLRFFSTTFVEPT